MNKKATILRKKSYFSSNINEVIKAVLKSFFFTKTINTLKTLKTQKALKALKALNGISGKSTKRK